MNKTQILTFLSCKGSNGERQFLADRPFKENADILRLRNCNGSVQDVSFETVSMKLLKKNIFFLDSGGGFASTWYLTFPIDPDIEKLL